MTMKTLIDSWDELPVFASEAEEQAWWETHDVSDRLLTAAVARERARRERGEPGARPADILGRAFTGAG
jgi:hypothetical protein